MGVQIEDFETNEHPDFSRANGAPMVMVDGKRVRMSRPSNFAKPLDDESALTNWRIDTACFGVAGDKSLQAAYVATKRDDRSTIKELREKAIQAGRGNDAAALGTAIHAMSERFEDPEDDFQPPEPYLSALKAYVAEMERLGLQSVHTEVSLVNVEYSAAGTADRIYRLTRSLIAPTGEIIPAGSHLIGDLKGLDINTPIPTPTGWATMASIQVGDQVIGSDGKPCNVTHKSDIRERECYRITFDDTTTVVADDEHRWKVLHGYQQARTDVVTTEALAHLDDGRSQRTVTILNASPLDLPDADLPLDPYVLGLWLADGSKHSGVITKPMDSGVWAEIKRRGFNFNIPASTDKCMSATVLGIRGILNSLGLLGNKHIPDVYMRGSIQQRLDLLRGLMDGDGTVNTARGGAACFDNTDKALALKVYELVVSLGERASFDTNQVTGFGLTVTAHHVRWSPRLHNPFVAEKADRVTVRKTGRNHRRLVTSVEKVVSVPTVCIAVDSPDHTYLCTESMLVTHNTSKTLEYSMGGFAAQMSLYAQSQMYDVVNDEFIVSPLVINQDWGLIAWIPSNQEAGHCEMIWIDLQAGNEACWVATLVKNYRKTWRNQKPVVVPDPQSVEDVLVAEFDAVPLVGWVRERIAAIRQHEEAGVALVRHWPAGIPTPKNGLSDQADIDKVLTLLDDVEAEYGLTWPIGDPRQSEGKKKS